MTLQSKFIRNLQKLIEYAKDEGIDILVYEGYRTAERQNNLYKNGLSNCDGYVTISKHQKGRAADLVVMVDGVAHWGRHWWYEKLGSFWERRGGKWGGRWTSPYDPYHFEM